MTSNDNDDDEFCYNCQRRHVQLQLKSYADVCRLKRKTYYGIKGRHEIIALCSTCDVYLKAGSNKGSWASMIWSFLSTNDMALPMYATLSFPDKWKYIPLSWRYWWIDAVSDQEVTLTEPPPEVFDVTTNRQELLNALSSLQWKHMAAMIDKYLAIPTIRCPWGCGCYLHECNTLPYEDLLLIRSNFAFPSNSDCASRHYQRKWVDSCRPDFPSVAVILDNVDFVCQPSVILNDMGPQLLCCKNHSQRNIARIVHIPTNPTGSLFTDASNQYAPVILKSRTLRKAKHNEFSDTYKTVALQGGYDGMDTSYCCARGNRQVTNHLSHSRDYLSLKGREDVRHNFQLLSQSPTSTTYLPVKNIMQMLNAAEHIYPNIESTLSTRLAGSTYVPIRDAISMQETAYNAHPITILCQDSNDPILYQPPWPLHMIRVHPFDSYGERFTAVDTPIAQTDIAGYHLWCIISCLLCVDVIWSEASQSMKTDNDAIGYLMQLAWDQRKCDSNRSTSSKVQKYYKFRTSENDDHNGINTIQHLVHQLQANDSAIALVWPTFANNIHISTSQDYLDPDQISTMSNIMIVTFSDENKACYLEQNNGIHSLSYGQHHLEFIEFSQHWEAVLVITKHIRIRCASHLWDGSIYARHGGSKHIGWWVQEHTKAPFRQCTIHNPLCVSNTRLIVFSRKMKSHQTQLRDRYLSYLGGQSVVFCRVHQFPLILSYKNKFQCCCNHNDFSTPTYIWSFITHNVCNKDGKYCCPHLGCKIAICAQHFTVFCHNSEHTKYLLTSTSCEKVVYNGSLASVPDPEDSTSTSNSESDNEDFINDGIFHSPMDQRNILHGNTTDTNDFGIEEEHEMITDLLCNDIEDDIDSSEEDPDNHDNTNMVYNVNIHDSQPNITLPFPAMTMAHSEEALMVEIDPMDMDIGDRDEIMSIPLHIFLNRQGHCLIRKNAKLRPTRRHQSFMQRLVSRSKGKCIPLLYGEATLFPDIFYFSTPDGDILGSLPSAFWTDQRTLSMYGIASMRSHAFIRINDPALLTMTDSRYHFLTMDILINLGLRGNDSRLLLHRGFAEKQGKQQGVAIRTEDGTEELYDDNVDNHANVHKLSRLCEKDPPHFFYTQTCNQTSAIGLRMLRTWVTSSKCIQSIMTKYNITRQEAEQTLRASAAPFVQSTWNVFINIWLQYIINSPEQPLGPIDWAWIRKEFQDKTGNVSHVHALIKTFIDVSTNDGKMQVMDKIRGAISDLIRYDEENRLIELGIVKSKECLIDILQNAIKYLTHKCGPRCMIIKKDEHGNDVFVCKRPYQWLLTSNPGVHSMQEIFVSHNTSTLHVLNELGLAKHHPTRGMIITHPDLCSIRHIPKCTKADGKFSPTNGFLFACYPSASNVQFVTTHCLSAYLSAYIADIDHVALVHLHPPDSNNPNIINGQYESLNNTKIKSIKNYHKNRLANRRTQVPTGRPITQMEALTVINAEPLVQSSIEFIHLPTSPREYRAAAEAPYKKSSYRPQDLQAVLAVTGQIARQRKGFPSHRMFTSFQLMVIRDELSAPLQTDSITHFSMRPPELLFVDNCILYLEWFERHCVCPLFNPNQALQFLSKTLNQDEHDSMWLDGFNYQIRVRRSAVRPLYDHAKKRMQQSSLLAEGTGKRLPSQATMKLLGKLVWMYEGYQPDVNYVFTRRCNEDFRKLSSLFLSSKTTRKLPVVWWTPVHPRRKTAFLIQILLCMGHFTTEYEVMLRGSLHGAFIEAGLLNIQQPKESLHIILHHYVLHHLRVEARSIYQFDRNVVEAYNILKEMIFPTTSPTPVLGTPAVLYSSMIRDCESKVIDDLDKYRHDFIQAIYCEMRNCGTHNIVPSVDSVMHARVDPIAPDIITMFFPPPRGLYQSIASHLEQSQIMLHVKSSLDTYRGASHCHRNFVFLGGPGVGKTTVATFCSLYCLCLGLNGITTSLVADRSKQLGGIHFHQLVGLKGHSFTTSPGRAAEMALQRMYRYPTMLELIRRLDFLNIDELGVFSAEYMGILDMVFRYVRGNSKFMGGIFVFCTMDHLQLLPFKGTPVLLSLYVITDFTFLRLQQSVRAARDPILQEIISLTRTINWDNPRRRRLANLLRNNVIFVDSFNDPRIPPDAVFVFGRKEPCRAVEKIMVDHMKVTYAGIFQVSHAYDEESMTGGNWHVANEGTKRILDKKIKQQRELVFYPNAKFEFTQVLRGKFSQGQLALMINVPSNEMLTAGMAISVFAAPSGVKNFPPPEECTSTLLVKNGWKEINVQLQTSMNEQIITGMQARRCQYPLKPRVSTTIHACMGSTLSSIVCAVVSLPNMPYNFSLWEAAQVVVLLSRTRTANTIFFVGDKEATIEHIISVLSGEQHKYLHFISSLLDKLCAESNDIVNIIPQPTTFLPKDAVIPRSPAVYLIVSTKQPEFAYIGETSNLSRRIREHNTLAGPQVTAQRDLLPFAIHAYVIGFDTKQQRLQFESRWKLINQRRANVSLNNNGRVTIAVDMISNVNPSRLERGLPPLRLIQCGRIATT